MPTRKPLLENLGGPVAPEAWRGALPITYHLGPGAADRTSETGFRLDLEAALRRHRDHPGQRYPDQWVMYGNHHDAWVNGASDPVSGAVGAARDRTHPRRRCAKQGWKPKRTIMLSRCGMARSSG